MERGTAALKDNPGLLANLKRRGRERALIYKTLVLTGLRRGELASISLGQVQLDGQIPHVILDAKSAKNRQVAELPLRADLVEDLQKWIAEKQVTKPDAPLFNVSTSLLRVLNRDLEAANIPKRDERGRTLDIHALRHSFGTFLKHIGSGTSYCTGSHAARKH